MDFFKVVKLKCDAGPRPNMCEPQPLLWSPDDSCEFLPAPVPTCKKEKALLVGQCFQNICFQVDVFKDRGRRAL
jgi:hypothetical protein